MAYALTPPPSASIATPTPSQLSLLSEACRSACGTACPRKQTGSRLSSQLSHAAQYARGSFPETLDLKSACYGRHCNRNSR